MITEMDFNPKDDQPQMEPNNKGKAPCKKWTVEEEKVLAHAWINVSEDPKVRNNQDEPT